MGWHTQARDAGSCGGHRTQLQGRKAGAVCFERLGAGSGGIKAGSYREAALQEELHTVSRGIDTFNSEVFARYGGQQKNARRYRELKDMLARPLPYSIRIDTFEIWRSERIYPDGVNLYQAPA